MSGFTYERPANGSLAWNQYAENAGRDQHMTAEEVLGNYYTPSGAETADIGDSAGMEQIEVYTGNIGDAEGVNYILTVHVGDRDIYGEYNERTYSLFTKAS